MFAGLITDIGEVVSLKVSGQSAVLNLSTGLEAGLGDSIAVNGVCLTVKEIRGREITFDLSYETLRSTNLSELRAGSRVNLEPALRADSRLGGHFVTGHVDGVGRIRDIKKKGDMVEMDIEAPKNIMREIVPKGSVAVDGISLTVVDVLPWGFRLVLIPHTLEVTTLGSKSVGSTVNIETDIIGKYVLRYIEGMGGSLMKKLKEEGFLGND